MTPSWFFIRIAKNAGTSIHHAIEDIPSMETLTIVEKMWRRHQEQLKSIKDPRYFCVIRNPYYRAVSMWKMFAFDKKKRWRIGKYKTVFGEKTSFEDFLLRIYIMRNGYENYRGKRWADDVDVVLREDGNEERNPYFWLMAHTQGQVGSIRFFLGDKQPDVIIKMEEMISGLINLNRHTGISFNVNFENKSKWGGDPNFVLSDRTREMCRGIWPEDFEYLKDYYDL